MAYKRIRDLAVVVGSYQDRATGQQKNRFENIGTLLKNEEGTLLIMLKATFNPAGVQRDPGRESIMVSVFDLRDDSAGGAPPRRPAQNGATTTAPAAAAAPTQAPSDADDDIPF